MDRTTPHPPREADSQIFALCHEHLTREEKLLADLLHSLRQVREAFFQRNLAILPSLSSRQTELTHCAQEMGAARERLRETLADQLGVSPEQVTLRTVARTLPEPGRGVLMEGRARLTRLAQETEKISQQNAALLGYARGFLTSLFATLTGTKPTERYGPHGERQRVLFGSFLEAQV
jgi:hypothetical protein